jgi:hypothetical protein
LNVSYALRIDPQVAWAGGKVYVVEEASSDDASHSPTLAWTVLQPTLSVAGTSGDACLAPPAWGQSFDFAVNRSAEFGASTQVAWEGFVNKAAEASKVVDQARYFWGSRHPRNPGLAPTSDGAVAAEAAEADPELAAQMVRTDVSPFVVPSEDVPLAAPAPLGATAPAGAVLPLDAAAGDEVSAATTGYTSYPCARGNKRCTFYGNYYGYSGAYTRWNCWSCGYGTNGFYVKSKYYTSYQVGSGVLCPQIWIWGADLRLSKYLQGACFAWLQALR